MQIEASGLQRMRIDKHPGDQPGEKVIGKSIFRSKVIDEFS